MKTEEIFGSLDQIDVISKRDDLIELTLICNGYVEGSDENCEALRKKTALFPVTLCYTSTIKKEVLFYV